MQENKVISSNITRDHRPLQNNLYDLVKVKPATPTLVNDVKEHACDFRPITGKIYTPKKRIKFTKVKTVRDIRNLFESDISIDLSKDLEKQQNLLLKKITRGSSREENTKAIARNMLKYDNPVSRSAWQMLMNVNAEGHPHAIQYVLWNGKRIRVNGSKGGKNTFLCNYDLANTKIPLKKETKHKSFNIKKGLLQNSLTVKFKPGPLTRKKSLDDSFQKYNVGKTELLNLPKPGLDIQPTYGVALEPMVANFVQSLRDFDGTISKKWAEFAVSVLGTVKNTEAFQDGYERGVTFELNYKRNQRRILLRRDVDKTFVGKAHSDTVDVRSQNDDESDITSNVENILKEMLDSVEISLQQDTMFTGEDEPRESSHKETMNVYTTKDKDKGRKRFCELDRLDVTVIRLPDIADDDVLKTCKNAHCSLGCICTSLQRSYNLRQHCGRLDCMFECKCDFSKYKVTNTFDNDCSELIPGLINLDNELNLKLAKEEQKFHQTVVLTGEKSILLKSERRNWKASKRYGDFYESMCLKNDVKTRRMLSVIDVKLNCENVEPWCMVHNLYKCFCKGKFTQKMNTKGIDENDMHETISHEDEVALVKNVIDVKHKKRHRLERNSADENANKHPVSEYGEIVDLDSDANVNDTTCARSRPYKGRKYYDEYYFNTNKKIIEMEQNDDHLRKRMLTILNKSEDSDASSSCPPVMPSGNILQSRNSIETNDENNSFGNITEPFRTASPSTGLKNNTPDFKSSSNDNITPDRSILNASCNKTKLIAWLESSYKQYKQRIQQGIVKKSLDPPKHGKVALYPWEFILSRYRERKNLFLISHQKPFRIFMAVDAKNSFFDNCINIDDIRFADLHKYPVTVKNLLTNATDLKDNFCILCGLHLCWELIGSVTKVDDQTNDTNELQSVADDKKIGFVAQDKKDNCNKDKPDKTDKSEFTTNYEDQIIAPEQTGSNIQNNEHALLNRIGKKRRRNFGKLKKIGAKKNNLAANFKDQINIIEQPRNTIDNTVCPHNSKKQDSDENESEVTDATTFEQDHNKNLPIVNNVSLEANMEEITATESEDNLNLHSSKWFVMTIENDFTEIQFYNRGFFVKYESIIKAINVARMSGKTVRLSTQKSGDQSNCPQFGIYAVPNCTEYYVFIGPYEHNEPLRIETVKSFVDIRKSKRTRGVWITTKKVDNDKVIDNPIAFMPNDLHTSKIVSLENEEMLNQSSENVEELKSNNFVTDSKITVSKDPLRKDHTKSVKPIKIRKANGFYQLAPQGFLKQVVPNSLEGSSIISGNASRSLLQPIILKTIQAEKRSTGMPLLQLPFTSQSLLKNLVSDNRPQNAKPVAEIAPQIKIVDVYSETATENNSQRGAKKPEGSMFILKPEEINKRLMANRLTSNPEQSSNNINNLNSDLDQDIENFLATSTVYVPPNADIFEISDEDDDQESSNWRNVWIECDSAYLGNLKGRRNANNMLSFEFPGFKFTDFYHEEEAFSKINQVLSRKIYVPKSINLTWRVVESIADLKRKFELKVGELGTDFVLTRRGVRHKKALMVGSKSLLKANSSLETATSEHDSKLTVEEVDNAIDIMSELEEQSKMLEDEGDKLMCEMAQLSGATLEPLSQPHGEEPQCSVQCDDLREKLWKCLQDND